MTPLSAVGLLCVLVARKYTLKRNVVLADDPKDRDKRPGTAGTESAGSNAEVKTQEEEKTSPGAPTDGADNVVKAEGNGTESTNTQ